MALSITVTKCSAVLQLSHYVVCQVINVCSLVLMCLLMFFPGM